MDDIKRGSLLKQRDNIVRDLHVDTILDSLYSLQALSTDDLEKIRTHPFRKDQAACLLEVLLRKDNRAYDCFVSVLQNGHEWLSKALTDVDEDQYDALKKEALRDTLVLGDVPRRPPHYVDRISPLRDLRILLEELQPSQRIVLYGMTGSGKSCLAAAAVKDALLLQRCFHNRVFWINLGEVKAVDQLPLHMNLLLRRLSNDTRELNAKPPRPASFNFQEGDTFTEIQLLKDALKNMFCLGSYRNALLVLDNVLLPEATEAFDVGCKTLITTQVKDIIVGNNTVYLQVKGGFTEKETLLLFANSLKTEVTRLPTQAIRIHYLCKGEPILIALIGSMLEPYKEDLLNNSDQWEYYIKKLAKKDYNLKTQLFGAISLCIERLNPDLRDLYQYFAVFVEDVNITPQVMQTIWKLEDKYAVQENMTQLENNSLIVSYYNNELKTYVYGIHDLFLAYLKQQLGAAETVELHHKLISAYKNISNNDYANLPNDNYIFQYIGYHLKHAQLYDDFKIYFDLKFIGAKIKAIGTADLLRDFQIYKDYITCNDESLVAKLEEYTNFIKAKGYDLFKYNDTSIVQCGLGMHKDSFIYKAALAIAKENPKSLYLQLQAPQESVYFTHTLDLHQDVSAACFTTDVDKILVGMTNGDITLWEQAYNQKLYVFSGHTDSVTHLQLSPNGDGFLSVSDDGCVKIWSLEGVVSHNNGDVYDENGFSANAPSPRVKQSYWTNFYGTNGRMDHSKTCTISNFDDRLTCASYANELEDKIATGCLTGRALIWNVVHATPVVEVDIPGRGQLVNCITFSTDDSLLIFSCGSSIFMHNAENGEFLSQFYNDYFINLLLSVPELDSTLIAINDNTITMWTWNQDGLKVMDPSMTLLDDRGQANFLCGAVTEDGMYLVAGSTDHYIRIWHIGTAQIVQEILNNKGLIVCLDTFYDDTKNAVHILLSGSDDKTVKQWHIQPTLQNKDTAKLLPIYDCFWNYSSNVPRIAVVNTMNKVQVMSGHSLIMESDRLRSPIKAVRFSLCGNKIAIGLENGDVVEFDYKNRHYETLMRLHDSIVLLKYFSTTKDNSLCRNYSKNDLLSEMSVLVATAQNGWVSMYKNNRVLCLIQPTPSNISLKQVPINPIVQCFYIRATQQLLTVSENRTIKVWDFIGSCHILYGDKIQQNMIAECMVTMATLSLDQSCLAITMADGCFETYCLNVENSVINMTWNQGKCFNSPLRSCRFSHNGKILALGQDNGDIVVWSMESKIALATLHLHKSWVRYLLFSPAPALILISVGEQIVWWDLTKLPDEAHSSKGYRRRSNSAKKKNLKIDIMTQMSNLNLGLWNDKEGNSEKPHLLSAIKVRGLFSTYISASIDFTSFFTIDKNGYLYIMEMLKPNYT